MRQHDHIIALAVAGPLLGRKNYEFAKCEGIICGESRLFIKLALGPYGVRS